jgi:hypothetical protein
MACQISPDLAPSPSQRTGPAKVGCLLRSPAPALPAGTPPTATIGPEL